MIRAVVRDGMIQPLGPLPTTWGDGQELQDTEGEPSDDPEVINRWARELSAISDRSYDPSDWSRLEATLAEEDRLAKDRMRREMGLE